MKFSHFKRVLFVCLVVFLTCLSTLSMAGFFNGKTKFLTTKTDHFYIHYSEDLGPVAIEMREIVESVHDRMTKRLHWTPKRRTHVVLTDRNESANGVASVLPDNYILLYVAIPTPDSSLDHYRDYYNFLFTHEYTHILHIDQHNRQASAGRALLGKIIAPNGATPGWMREGMAVYEESILDEKFGRNNSDYTEMVLRTSQYEGKFPQIDQVAGLSSHFPGGLGPYLFGGKFFQWLGENYGEDRIHEYQREYASSLWLYSLNNKARRVFGKSFYKLWKEFSADMKARYDSKRDALNSQGLTGFTDVVKNRDSIQFFTPHPNGQGFAYYQSGLDDAPKIVIDAKDGSEPHEIKRRLFGQMSFSKNGRYLAFGSLSSIQRKTSLGDVFYYDLKNRRLFRVSDNPTAKKSLRVMDPDFSSADGGSRWLVMTRSFLGTDQLYVFDLFEKRGYLITQEPQHTQFSHPRFSPDGENIVVSRKDPVSGNRDIVVYSKTGTKIAQITNDVASDMHPIFSRDGGKIYFTSSRTGIFNIFSYDLQKDELAQISNVESGVFQPMPAYGTDEMFVQYFSVENTYARKFSVKGPLASWVTIKPYLAEGAKVFKTKNAAAKKSAPRKTASISNPPAVNFSEPASAFNFSSEENLTLNETSMDSYDVAANLELPGREGDFPRGAFAEPDETGTDSKPVLPVYTDDKDTTKPQSPKVTGRRRGRSKKEDVQPVVETKTYPSPYKDALAGVHNEVPVDTSQPSDAKRYTPFPHLLRPSYVIPNLLFYENAVMGSMVIGRFDPLYRHSWTGFIDYRSDAKFVGGGGTYVYSRWDPTFYVGGLRYAVDWGTIQTATQTVRFFEERWQAYGGTGYKTGNHSFNLMYFYEHRGALTPLAGVNFVNMKPYAGTKFQYTLANYKKFSDSISQEDGYLIKAVIDVTDSMLMSDAVNEEIVSTLDLRYYFEMPWSDHHVFAVRVAGGWQWGDIQQFGTFRLGGPLGEGTGAAKYSSRVFPLRGLAGISYGGDRAFIFSAEYRLPLAENVNAGIGTWPIFLDKLHMNFFVDGGDIKYRSETDDLFTRLMVAGGAELKGDFMLGYGLPITTRLGYGIIFTNRERLGNLQDAITRASLKFGSAYFQVGTSF